MAEEMTFEAICRVLGRGVTEEQLEALRTFGVTGVDVIHARPALQGPTEPRSTASTILDPTAKKFFTGYQMAGHLRTVKRTKSATRFFYAPMGGWTAIGLRLSDGVLTEIWGEATCSEGDVFCRATGRRIALDRALDDAAALLAPPEDAMSKWVGPTDGFLRTLTAQRAASGRSPLEAFFKGLDFGKLKPLMNFGASSSQLLWAPSRREALEDAVTMNLEMAEKADAAITAETPKAQRKFLRASARALREQAEASAACAAQLRIGTEAQDA